tara:strand:- start:83 stop:289 length:207 start_codon:yes stop_codon:yes gene_type:complete
LLEKEENVADLDPGINREGLKALMHADAPDLLEKLLGRVLEVDELGRSPFGVDAVVDLGGYFFHTVLL